MERKIGEIFELGGEWYQCLERTGCFGCGFECTKCYRIKSVRGECVDSEREDRKDVIFKKLEKVGEPYYSSYYKQVLQEYKYYTSPIISDTKVHILKLGIVSIEIKQNKEDMEEKDIKPYDKIFSEGIVSNTENLVTSNLKPFDLEAAKSGKPVCTRDGRKARIICFDKRGGCPIIALVETFVVEYDCIREETYYYTIDGREIGQNAESKDDLMMLPEKKEGWVNVYNSHGVVTFSHNPYDTKEEAMKDKGKYYVDTIKVEWKE